MKWSFTKFEECCVIDLPKNVFEKENIEALKNLMEELTEDGCKTFLLNMGQLSKINDVGLGMILGLYKFSFYHEVSIKLYNLQSYVSQMIFQTRLNIIFDICQTDDECLEKLNCRSKVAA
jgi:anti-anti-sigma factor